MQDIALVSQEAGRESEEPTKQAELPSEVAPVEVSGERPPGVLGAVHEAERGPERHEQDERHGEPEGHPAAEGDGPAAQGSRWTTSPPG